MSYREMYVHSDNALFVNKSSILEIHFHYSTSNSVPPTKKFMAVKQRDIIDQYVVTMLLVQVAGPK